MNALMGSELSIRSMVYVAAEKVPFFWPMRAFIHHNPLHGFEHLHFSEAVQKGSELFHARVFLSRKIYQQYLQDGQVDRQRLRLGIERFLQAQNASLPFDLEQALLHEMTLSASSRRLSSAPAVESIYAKLHDDQTTLSDAPDGLQLTQQLTTELLQDCLFYEALDRLYQTDIAKQIDESVIRACLDFFDEGQSVWHMPERDKGFFKAWLEVAGSDVLRSLQKLALPADVTGPERVIEAVLKYLQIDKSDWLNVMAREFARLHGWVGFIRWRSSNKQYYWQQRFPADLVDFLAIRLLVEMTVLQKRSLRHLPQNVTELKQLIVNKPIEIYLRQQFAAADTVMEMVTELEAVLANPKVDRLDKCYRRYSALKQQRDLTFEVDRLHVFMRNASDEAQLSALSLQEFTDFYQLLQAFDRCEGMLWLEAMESHAAQNVLGRLSLEPEALRDKRPFAKALFCIDTRSERIRRHLESVGDYQTYGIAGFFGVPVSFIELGRGSEHHLCPVLLKPKNLVIEMTVDLKRNIAALSTLEHAVHDLKESVLTPFVTVEAIGLLFGFDMIGKTLMPAAYNEWRKSLHEQKPQTHLMLDKLSREQADSVVRAVQRAVIQKALALEFDLQMDQVSDDMIRELREAALRNQQDCPEFSSIIGDDALRLREFVGRLQNEYRINQKFAQLQLERLGRIGFSLDEQTRFVILALQSIGLKDAFSRFILMVGHGSRSENNPYESALDCGACGGSHGLVSARVISQMANKPEVRNRLRRKGIDIPDDCWFIPAMHNTTTDEIELHDLSLLPPTHLPYLDRLREGLDAASRLSAQERLPSLMNNVAELEPRRAYRGARRNAMDWSQVRPEWGLSGNAYFIIGRRSLTQSFSLDGRAFLHSYDYQLDKKRHLLENILTGPLVVGQWINMEHYFSTVDNERFGSGSKAYHNVVGRFGVMTGNFSDLRTGLPSQTVLKNGQPYHQPMRLITLIEAPLAMAQEAIEQVVTVKRLVNNEWIRLFVVDPQTSLVSFYEQGQWHQLSLDTQWLNREVVSI